MGSENSANLNEQAIVLSDRRHYNNISQESFDSIGKDGKIQEFGYIKAKDSNKSPHMNPPFSGSWSRIYLSGNQENFPSARTGHFTLTYHSKSGNFNEREEYCFVGFGRTNSGKCLDDIWSFDMIKKMWKKIILSGDATISSRMSPAATVVKDFIVLFGGFNGKDYLNDMFLINWRTGIVKSMNPEINNDQIPPPMANAVISFHNSKLYLYGKSSLFVYDVNKKIWIKEAHLEIERPVDFDKFVAFSKLHNDDNIVYSFGGDNKSIFRLDLEKEITEDILNRGSSPPFNIFNASMTNINDEYLIFYGGDGECPYTILYGYSIFRNWWFIFFVRPDEETVSETDGKWNSLNLFMTPRKSSFSLTYSHEERQLIGFLGTPMDSGRNIFVINVADALSFLHLRGDMIDMLQVQ